MMTSCRPDELLAQARMLLETPYQHRGRTPGIALDCAGVLICAAKAAGIAPADFEIPDYSLDPDGTLMLRWLNKYMGGRIPKSALAPGHAVVIRTDLFPQHLGIVGSYHGTKHLSLLHASNALSTRPARVIETPLLFSRTLQFVAGYKFPGVAYQ